jgi:hypothetical protein
VNVDQNLPIATLRIWQVLLAQQRRVSVEHHRTHTILLDWPGRPTRDFVGCA